MFSIKGDVVLDPFFGIGTTMYAAMAAARNSIGYEIDRSLRKFFLSKNEGIVSISNQRIVERLSRHADFVEDRYRKKGQFKYTNKHYLFPVMTRQETDLIVNEVTSVKRTEEDNFVVTYSNEPQENFIKSWDGYFLSMPQIKGSKRIIPKCQMKIG
jgi:hypothetical protein